MSWVATAVAGSAIIGTAGSIYGASEASSAAEAAAAAQAEATLESTKLQLEYLRETREDLAEAVEKGIVDLDTAFNAAIENLKPDEYDALRNYVRMISNPQSVMERPGVRFQYEQGMDTLQSAFSRSSGGGLSGRMIKAAEEYGQNFAATALDRELARLQPLISNQITKQANISNLYSDWGKSKANLRVGGEAQIAGVTGGAIPAIASGVAAQGNIAASNMINQSNIATNTASNISGLLNDAAMTFAMYKSGLFKGG